MYTGYYCKKCKIIPLIKSTITDNKELQFILKCKCNINCITLEEINKKYFTKNIEKKHIINEVLIDDIETDDSLLLKIKEILSKIKNNNKQLLIIKNKIINFLNEKMKEIEYLYDKTIKINENLEKLILTLIKSYETINSNYSNIINIKYLTNINCEHINDDMNILINEKEFNKSIQGSIDIINKHIYVPNDELQNISQLWRSFSKELKIYNKELLILQTENSLCIYPISDLKPYVEILFLQSLIKFDIDKESNILCLFQDCVQIFSKITYEQIKPFKNNKKKRNYNIPLLDVKPILIIRTKIRYINIISLDDEENRINKYIVHNQYGIDFFEYDLNKKRSDINNSFKCELIKIELIKYNNNKVLLLFNSLYLFMFDLLEFKIIKKLKIDFRKDDILTSTQINDEELLITQKNFIFLIKLKNLQIKLKIKYDNDITHIYQLKDKSLIICGIECSKRLSSKTFTVMNIIYKSNDIGYFSQLTEEYYPNYIYITKSIQISNTEIVIILKNGECLLKKLSI